MLQSEMMSAPATTLITGLNLESVEIANSTRLRPVCCPASSEIGTLIARWGGIDSGIGPIAEQHGVIGIARRSRIGRSVVFLNANSCRRICPRANMEPKSTSAPPSTMMSAFDLSSSSTYPHH